MDPQLALWALDGVVANTLAADRTGILACFPYNITANTRDHEIGLLGVDMGPFIFHANLPCLEFGKAILLGVRDVHQIICTEQLAWHTSVDNDSSTKMESSRLRTEAWCTSNSTPNSSLYWPLTSTRLRVFGTWPGSHVQPIHLHSDFSWPTTGPFFAHNRRLSEGRQRQNRGVCWFHRTFPAGGEQWRLHQWYLY